MTRRVLLASDLDRTLLPNGPQPESARARPLLRALAERDELILAYVSGRHLALVREAIAEFQLPEPAFIVGDVGSTIYRRGDGGWEAWFRWSERIAPRWAGCDRPALAALFADLSVLRLQEASKQNTFKLSYYAPADLDRDALLAEMQRRLAQRGVEASLVWSVDETTGTGLLDVLPAGATKLEALRFVLAELAIPAASAVFAGDSGNDLPVLTSDLQGVLVANAAPAVREEAVRLARAAGHGAQLYLARGGFLGMNGRYAAGVLEGLAHYVPLTGRWMTEALAHGDL